MRFFSSFIFFMNVVFRFLISFHLVVLDQISPHVHVGLEERGRRLEVELANCDTRNSSVAVLVIVIVCSTSVTLQCSGKGCTR